MSAEHKFPEWAFRECRQKCFGWINPYTGAMQFCTDVDSHPRPFDWRSA